MQAGDRTMEDYADLQPHQQRVVDESNEMNERTKKLGDFYRTDLFKGLDEAEQRRLNRQANIMQLYCDVLQDRILAF